MNQRKKNFFLIFVVFSISFLISFYFFDGFEKINKLNLKRTEEKKEQISEDVKSKTALEEVVNNAETKIVDEHINIPNDNSDKKIDIPENSVDGLLEINNLNEDDVLNDEVDKIKEEILSNVDKLFLGEEINKKDKNEVSLNKGYVEYIIQVGDNWEDIAKKFNIDVYQVLQNYNPDVETLQPGNILFIPIPPTKKETEYINKEDIQNNEEVENEISEENNDMQYVVQIGDTWGKIAKKFKIPNYKELQEYNSEVQRLYSNNIIAIPREYINWVEYTVVQGDTWEKIAIKYGISVENLKDANDYKSLLLGEIILIPSY